MNAPLHPIGTAALAGGMAVLFFVMNASAQAQENPPPAPAPAPAEAAQTDIQKWIAATDAQWQAAFKRDVSEVHETDLQKLHVQYLTLLDDALNKASAASDLDGAVALRKEQKRFADARLIPGANPFPAQDDAAEAASVKQVRATIRTQLLKVETATAARARTLHAKYDPVLAQVQTQLTQRQRFDEALLVKAKRDEVAAAWITPVVAGAAEKGNPPAPLTPVNGVPKPAPAPKVAFGTKAGPVLAKVEAEGTVLKPFVNGAIAFSNRAYVFTEVPSSLDGHRFTQAPMGAPPLAFKVVSDGLVQMACTSRFAQKKKSGWESEVTTEKMLEENGWHKERELTFATTDPNYVWTVYARQCKAGEKFTIRTEKYATPILLVK